MPSRQHSNGESETMTRARALGLHGLLADWNRVKQEPWVEELLRLEESERKRRSLDRRMRNAHIGEFKHMTHYDWSWPRKINRLAVEDVVSGCFLREKSNVVIVGGTGASKTMIAKNTAYNAAVDGYSVRFTTVSEMLADLGEQDTSTALCRRLPRYCRPDLLCIDEIGYLSYNARAADLLFEVVSQRCQTGRSILATTNKSFEQWGQVFASAGCLAIVVDRLLHRCEVLRIDAESYRAKESSERARTKEQQRAERIRKT